MAALIFDLGKMFICNKKNTILSFESDGYYGFVIFTQKM